MTPEAQLALIAMIGTSIVGLLGYMAAKLNAGAKAQEATGEKVKTIEMKVDGRFDSMEKELAAVRAELEAANKTAAHAEGVIEGTQAEQARTTPS